MKLALPAVALLTLCAACASAADPQLEKVRKVVAEKLQGVAPEDITQSSAPGLYQIQKGQEFGYLTSDGRFFIHGDMIDLVTGEEVTEKQRGVSRMAVVKQFGPDQLIEFAPKDAKYYVTVFTDLDCGFCRKLHSQISEYNAQGIGIRYLFYPRGGPNTPSWEQAKAVWCSADRKDAFTKAKQGVHIMGATNCPNPVEKQWMAGESVGVNATPTLVMPDGEVVRGYVPPQALAAKLAQSLVAKTKG